VIIEYASVPHINGGRQQLRSCAEIAARHAPVHIKALIDRQRLSNGLPPLWPDASRTVQIRTRVQSLQQAAMGVLVGTCTAGLGVPTSCGFDKHHLPEVFEPQAFRHSVIDIHAGKASAWISLGHTADDLGSTNDGRLHVWVDPQMGLMFQMRLLNTDDHRQLAADARMGRLGVSVGFSPKRMSTRKLRGKSTRVIHEAVLSHIGLCRMGEMVPAFRSNLVIHSWGRDEVAIDAAIKRASMGAWLAHRQAKGS
jgi:hypothetical protein